MAAETGEHVCILNDDVLVHPRLRKICEAMIEAVPEEPISLHTAMLGAAAQEMLGHHWVRSYWYSGPGVLLPPGAVLSLLDWVYKCPWYFLSRNNEDNVAIHWAWEQQRPFYCAVPAPVIHDTALASTLGYDDHPWRVPSVPWTDFPGAKLTDVSWWAVQADPPLVENPWMDVRKLAYVRSVMREPGHQMCHFCMAREGVISPSKNPLAPRLCHTCLMKCYGAAIKYGVPSDTE
jgi:hypothetical protein